jgi:hypothetical protein
MSYDRAVADMKQVWVSERGPGPLVVVRKVLLDFWSGADAPSGERSDYGRACAIGEIGCVEIKGGTALVLGDEPLRTTWLPRPQGGMFVRWIAADDEASALGATDMGADATWSPTGCTFTTAGGAHVLFAASVPGRNAKEDSLTFDLREGDYDVSSAVLEQGSASVVVYRVVWRPKGKPGAR